MSDSEREPLLSRGGQADDPSKPKWGQLLLLMSWRSAHPITFAFIFPFIAPFLVRTGIATPKNVGGYAGIVEAAFSASVLVGLLPAMLASDTLGRKPTILIGLCGAAVATVFFGFAGTLWQMVLLRALVGFSVAFIPATVATMLVELATKETQPLHFALNGLGWQLGTMVAPLLGGALADPASTWPGHFHGFWERYPYALPCLLVGGLVVVSIILGLLFTKETLPPSKRRQIACLAREKLKDESQADPAPLSGLFTRPAVFIVFLWFIMVFVSFLNLSCEVLFFYTPVHLGGLALTSKESALFWAIRPAATTAYEMLVYPKIGRRWGPERVLRTFVVAMPLVYLVNFAIATAAAQGSSKLVVYSGLALVLVLSCITAPAYLAASQLVSSRAPSRMYITRISTASEYASNAGHGLGAFVGSNLFKLAVEMRFLHGRGVWLAHFSIAVVVAVIAQRVTHEPGWRELEEEEQRLEHED